MPKKSKKEDDEKRGIARYFSIRKEVFKKHKKAMLLMQCGTFFEIYGYEEEGDPLWEYWDIMDCKAPFPKSNINGQQVFCCGHQVVSLDTTIKRLMKEGWYVEVFNEIDTDSKNKKIHGHMNSFSPGTFVLIDNGKMLTNNCICISIEKSMNFKKKLPSITVGISSINTISGSSKLYEYTCTTYDLYTPSTFEELDRFISINNPKEIWLIHNLKQKRIDEIMNFASLECDRVNIYSSKLPSERLDLIRNCQNQEIQKEILLDQFEPNDPDFWYEIHKFNDNKHATFSYCFLLKVMLFYNPDLINKLITPEIETLNNKLILRTHSLRQLNIIDTMFNKGAYSSIERLINKCKTNMGKREFKNTIVTPTNNPYILNKEYDIIEHILNNPENIEKIRSILNTISDIERLYRKFVLHVATPSDISTLYYSFVIIKEIYTTFVADDEKLKEYLIFKNKKLCYDDLNKLIDLLDKTFKIDVCADSDKIEPEKIFFKRDVHKDLDKEEDKWNEINDNLNKWKTKLESIIKVDNSVHLHKTEKSGVYLKATANRCKAITKYRDSDAQTDPYGEGNIELLSLKVENTGTGDKNKKFTCHELTELYNGYSQSYDNLSELLNCKFKQFVRNVLLELHDEIRSIVNFVSIIDIIYNKAYISKKYNYCKPTISDRKTENTHSFFDAKDLRHPLVEHIQTNETYVTNNISLGLNNHGMLLFGVNTSGKSTIIKAIGIAIIMAQAGMYVPATEFIYKPYNTIFTRILSNDNLFKALSSFATEMSEFQYIEKHSDGNSLVLGDELCNGTEIDSAISIFGAGLKFLNKRKTSHIFATHLHPIIEVKDVKEIETLDVKHLEVKYNDAMHELIYKRKLIDGVGQLYYGLEVCKQFDFSNEFMEDCYNIRNEIHNPNALNIKTSSYSSKKIRRNCEFCGKVGEEMHHLNPQEYANDENGYIDTHHKNHKANLANVCKECHHNFTVNKIIYERIKTSSGYKLIEI
ncbi:MAG: hypothetical protein CXT73_04220 [Methanobacteriota archaeon]|nr:MAG: hypothetical protein CXT73_04220 [Euryarchaeota archaeon]